MPATAPKDAAVMPLLANILVIWGVKKFEGEGQESVGAHGGLLGRLGLRRSWGYCGDVERRISRKEGDPYNFIARPGPMPWKLGCIL